MIKLNCVLNGENFSFVCWNLKLLWIWAQQERAREIAWLTRSTLRFTDSSLQSGFSKFALFGRFGLVWASKSSSIRYRNSLQMRRFVAELEHQHTQNSTNNWETAAKLVNKKCYWKRSNARENGECGELNGKRSRRSLGGVCCAAI